ncbi:hypothetical protein A2U01_0094375, partial [Trifolium medium]|nr:hypothetical protein [Trifolium medium]
MGLHGGSKTARWKQDSKIQGGVG